MEYVLNKVFTQDITNLIIKLAKELYHNDRIILYSLIYTKKPENINYKKYKYNYNTSLDGLLDEILNLKINNLLDINTCEKIYRYLLAYEIINIIDVYYEENTKNYNEINKIKSIFQLINKEQDSYLDNNITRLKLYQEHVNNTWISGKSWIYW